MKKYLLATLIFVVTLACLPTESQAHYTGWNSPLNNYMRYNMNNRLIRNHSKRGTTRRVHSVRRTKRHTTKHYRTRNSNRRNR